MTTSSITNTGASEEEKHCFTNYSNNKAAAAAPSPHTDVASLLPTLPVGVGVGDAVPETVVLEEEEELVDEEPVVPAEGAVDDLEPELVVAVAVAAMLSMELTRPEGTSTPATLQNSSANCRVFSWSAGLHLVTTQVPMLSMKPVLLQMHLKSL